MPSYKFDEDSESDEEQTSKVHKRSAAEDEEDAEPGPDDTFHFRQSFSSKTRHPYLDMNMKEAVFDSDDDAAEEEAEEGQGMGERSYEDDNMHDDEEYYSDEEELDDDEEEEESLLHDTTEVGQIQKRATWL